MLKKYVVELGLAVELSPRPRARSFPHGSVRHNGHKNARPGQCFHKVELEVHAAGELLDVYKHAKVVRL